MSTDAEVAAIACAAKKIADTPVFPINIDKFVILSDSISAIQFVTQAANLHPTPLLFKKSLLKADQQQDLRMQWIPSHCDSLGKEKADFLIKASTKKNPPTSALHVGYTGHRFSDDHRS
jgi:ribonuclease HI